MHPNLIAYAAPVFFVAIVAESYADRAQRAGIYRFSSAIADLDTGIASQVVDVFLKLVGLSLYAAVYRHRWVDYGEGSAWPWVVGLVGIDFVYYWWHRLSHIVNVLWAVHAVHHQSEDFNFAVALRQPAFEALTIIPFHLPLALLGVPPAIYVSSYAIDLIYQFWIHTEFPGRVGWLEWVLNMPSAHRVHHGINSKYLDRNFGGVLAVWDRLFGTYQPEQEPAVYGVTHALRSYNPLWANLAPFRDIAALSSSAVRPIDKLRAWVAHPAWRPAQRDESPLPIDVSREVVKKYDPRPPSRVTRYVFAHFVLLALSGGAFLSLSEGMPLWDLVAPASLILASALALAAWTEGRPWALAVDTGRQVAAVVLIAVYFISRFGWSTGTAVASGFATLLIAIFGWFRPETVTSRAAG
jgi:sterol desaturase/sphingolipid hydroxylase (fatty acid hydroxylase superfamily)